jgi:phosphoribosylformimino-5-aminoimidazole carboxamide ribotide isomerase
LCEGAEPVVVARALMRHCGSDILYVADLDALTGGAAQLGQLRTLLAAEPACQLWLDAGLSDRVEGQALLAEMGVDAQRVQLVFASESLRDAPALAALCGGDGAHREDVILSLDRRQGVPLDAAGCWTTPSAWPRRVIVMTLERVGAGAGPDLDTLAAVRALAPSADLIGAGGIRDQADLRAAEAAGAHAWLVASALHDGAIAPAARAQSGPGARVSP